MKRADIRKDQVLWYTNSTKYADPDAYAFGDGHPVVVLSEDRYYLRPADSSYYWGSRYDVRPRQDPYGKGVLVAELFSRSYGDEEVVVTEKVVNPAHLRGDWYEVEADLAAKREARRILKERQQAQFDAYYAAVNVPARELAELGLTSAGISNAGTYRGRVTLSAEDAALVAVLLRDAVLL